MKTSIRVSADQKDIFLTDLDDKYNGTSAYNRGKRSIRKAVAHITENRARLEELSIFRVCEELDAYGLNMRVYCAMD